MFDLQSFTSQVYARLKSDAAGVSVRAALGAAATSIVHAEELKTYVKKNGVSTVNAPLRPLLAFRSGPVAGNSYDMRIPLYTWWIYDDPEEGYWRINGVQRLIEQAYYPPFCIPFAHITTANIGQETTDPVLGWAVRTLQLALTARG